MMVSTYNFLENYLNLGDKNLHYNNLHLGFTLSQTFI